MTEILALIAGGVALGLVARQFNIPYPIALVLGGLAMSFIPGLPVIEIDTELALTLVLPPILYQAAIFTSWRDFRANIKPIGVLAIGLVLVTTLGVAAVARLIVPGMPWNAALVLGAIVSPSDAVAATAIMRHLSIPRRIVTVIEGESLVNDAAGLVLYRFAVAAVLTGTTYSFPGPGLQFLALAIGGTALGIAAGWLSVQLQRRIADPLGEIALSLTFPFAVFIAAEYIHVSAVLAVVAAGLVRGWYSPEVFSAQTRIQAFAVWDVIVFLINTVVFILIGLMLPQVMAGLTQYSIGTLAWYATSVSLATIALRFIVIFGTAYGRELLVPSRRRRASELPWRHLVIVAWSGMRGVVSLVIALALPMTMFAGAPFPQRELIIFLTYAVIIATLVLQGASLGWVIRFLGVGADCDTQVEERLARTKTLHAAMAEIDAKAEAGEVALPVARALRDAYAQRLNEVEAIFGDWLSRPTGPAAPAYRSLHLDAIAAARHRLIKLRREGQIGDEVLQRVQRELDLEEVRLTGISA
jgi:CPA1 family monovalent cation:H+ antiporter